MTTKECLALPPAAFRRWVSHHPPGTVIGCARNERDCPLVRFIFHKTDLIRENLRVRPATIRCGKGGASHSYQLPRWMRLTVKYVDCYHLGRRLTREQVLKIISRVEQQLTRRRRSDDRPVASPDALKAAA